MTDEQAAIEFARNEHRPLLSEEEIKLFKGGCQFGFSAGAAYKEAQMRELHEYIEELEHVSTRWMNDYDDLKAKYEPMTLECPAGPTEEGKK